MADHDASTSKRYLSALQAKSVEVFDLLSKVAAKDAELDKARHELETLRGKTGFCPMCVRLTEERDKLRRELDELDEAAGKERSDGA